MVNNYIFFNKKIFIGSDNIALIKLIRGFLNEDGHIKWRKDYQKLGL